MNQSQIEHDDDDGEGDGTSPDSVIVNISDDPITINLGTQPGSKPRKITLQPFGQRGSQTQIQRGYTQPYKGAGRKMVQATIERMTEREIVSHIAPTALDPGRQAIRVPLVVHESMVESARRRYLAAVEKSGVQPVDHKIAAVAGAMSRLASSRGVAPTPRRAKPAPMPVDDEEDQAGGLDDEPPDDDVPLASEAPALAKATKSATDLIEPATISGSAAPVSAGPEPVVIPRRGNDKGKA